ncbi:MAG TPA: LLM class flavin-dependent oxidoreductase [Acetobacteraceae bacterium]|nr:LLM class flavin-dependent oxidoreductase [Acetobacteraceae bacterium]
MPLPAISLVAVPGRRRLTLDLARDIERRGFAGIYTPSMYGNMSQCEAMCWTTERIPFGTAIAPLYARTVLDFAQSAAFMHEVSGGRFRLGIGVAHAPGHQRMGVTVGKPLGDTRSFVERLRAVEGIGDLPPIIIAALRQKMVALAGEMSQGVVFANVARSHMAASLGALPSGKRNDPAFFIGNMLPTCISDDIEAAKAVCRKNLIHYAFLPNYRNSWKEAGYVEEMTAIEQAIAAGRRDDVPRYLTDRWLADVSLFGSAAQVRTGVEAWQAAGVHTPVIVPSSASGGQLKAIEELFAAFG